MVAGRCSSSGSDPGPAIPAHAVVLSLDEKSQIQALGPHPTWIADQARALPDHDTRLQAARHHDPIRRAQRTGRSGDRPLHAAAPPPRIHPLPHAVEREVPAEKPVHAVLDNYATHKHPKVLAWLSRHPRRTFHFTPTSASWLNALENFFSKMTRQRIRRGVFRSIADLQAAINIYLAEHNASPKPFVWTKSADAILAKLNRCPVPSV